MGHFQKAYNAKSSKDRQDAHFLPLKLVGSQLFLLRLTFVLMHTFFLFIICCSFHLLSHPVRPFRLLQ